MARNLTVAIAPDDFKPANELEPAVSHFKPVMPWCASLPGTSAADNSGADQALWLSHSEMYLDPFKMPHSVLRPLMPWHLYGYAQHEGRCVSLDDVRYAAGLPGEEPDRV